MMFKLILLLSVGAFAANEDVTVNTDCEAAGFDEPIFPHCVSSGDDTNTITVYWRPDADNADNIEILVGTNADGANWCGWGISDGPSMPDSSVIVGVLNEGGDEVQQIDGADGLTPGAYDRKVEDRPGRPIPSPEAERQEVTGFGIFRDEDTNQLCLNFKRPKMVAGLAPTRHLTGDVYMIAACGTSDTFTAQHDINAFWFQINVDTGVLTGSDPPAGNGTGNGTGTATPTDDGSDASSPQLSAALTIAVGAVASMLW